MPNSIRSRMLLWLGGLLLAILFGFGFTAFQLHRQGELTRLDEELTRRLERLQEEMPNPFGNPVRFTPNNPVPAMPLARFGGGNNWPPRWGNRGLPGLGFAPPAPPISEFSLPPFPTLTSGVAHATFTLSREASALFDATERLAFYYAIWWRSGRELARAPHAPVSLTLPTNQPGGASQIRFHTRGGFREGIHFTERGQVLLAGVSLAPLAEANQRFAWSLVAGGGIVMLVALGGAWAIIRASLRPVTDISRVATRFAGGDLRQRIPVRTPGSELGQLADVLNATFARLEASFDEQKHFTADASHELRTPVTVLLTETQHALSRERTPTEYRASLETCRSIGREMRSLLGKLLQLARLDAGQDTMEFETFAFDHLALGTVKTLESLAAEKGIRLETDCTPVRAWGDSGSIRQVLINLVENAVRYNRPGGEVRIATSAEGKSAVLTVSDTGIGIGPADLPHIFERFYRADKARSRPEGANGLGLSICKAIVDAHGGSIEVRSEAGRGTTFLVRLPSEHAAAEPAPELHFIKS